MVGEGLLNSQVFVGVPWVVYLGFLRLMTGRHVLQHPYPPNEITRIVGEWFQIPAVSLLRPTDDTRRILEGLIAEHHLSGSMITDASIVAQAIEHGACIHSNDSDFSRFKGAQIRTPLS